MPKAVKKRLWYRCFPVNFAKFLRTSFLQNTSGRLLRILAFQKQPLEVSMKKAWKFLKIHRKTPLVWETFKNTFFTEHLWMTGSGFFAQRYWNGILRMVFRKPQMNIHYLKTLTLEVPFRYTISFFSRINFQCISSLVYTVYCQKQPSE